MTEAGLWHFEIAQLYQQCICMS